MHKCYKIQYLHNTCIQFLDVYTSTSLHFHFVGPGDKVCYYYGPKQAVYEELGHAEVVQMELRGESAQTRRQMEAFADTYFGQFRKTPFGMMRLDPQDAGPAYRNVIGIPKGVNSPLFDVLKVYANAAMLLLSVVKIARIVLGIPVPGKRVVLTTRLSCTRLDMITTLWLSFCKCCDGKVCRAHNKLMWCTGAQQEQYGAHCQ